MKVQELLHDPNIKTAISSLLAQRYYYLAKFANLPADSVTCAHQ